jgi:E3 UFM1-protein ligase 1
MMYQTILAYGRVNLIEFPSYLDVSIENIEPRIKNMMRRFSDVLECNQNYFTSRYLDRIAEEMNAELLKRGKLKMEDLSS